MNYKELINMRGNNLFKMFENALLMIDIFALQLCA